MHWTERRRAVVRIGEELQRRGWTLYGYTPDRSDAMSDYWAPATWDGVAVKDGATACVDVSEYTTRRAGQDIIEHTSVPGEPCAHCQGTGIWPGGLTYEEAKANPAGQHFVEYCAQRGSRPGHPDVVSPLHYHGVGAGDDANPDAPFGAPKCLHCSGRGHRVRTESTVVGRWPSFQANPKAKTWHVERDGRIVGSGVGLQGCASYDQEEADAAVARICDRIEALTFPAAREAREQDTVASGIVEREIPFTVYREDDWTWIAFGRKPSPELRERLKRAGGRWGKRRGAWYFKRAMRPQDLAALGLPVAPDEAVPADETAAELPPWTMSRRTYQENRALAVAGGVPILNAQDGRDHEAAVRKAVAVGLPVSAHVLADYPDLAKLDAVAPPDEGDAVRPDEPGPAAGSGPAMSPGAEPAQDVGDYRLAELGCPGCGLTFHGMVGSRAAVPDPARCPRCGTVGVALDEDDPPARRDPDGYCWVELHCQSCDLTIPGLLGPQVTQSLIRCPGCGRSPGAIRPLDMPAAWMGHGAALAALMQRLADDEVLRGRMQNNGPEKARLAFDRRVDDLLPHLVDTHWEFYRLLAEQPAVMAVLLARLFRWYYPLAEEDADTARTLRAAATGSAGVDETITLAELAEARELAAALLEKDRAAVSVPQDTVTVVTEPAATARQLTMFQWL